MANEINVRASLQIKKGNLDFQSKPTVFKSDMTGLDGPTPGTITCAVAPGTDVDLSELTTPGMCWMMNLDATNYVTVGIRDPESNLFYPFLELLPGEFTVFRLARNVEEEYATGTGTVGANTNRIRIVANNAACNVAVFAFEK
jgi:hypothetical protein